MSLMKVFFMAIFFFKTRSLSMGFSEELGFLSWLRTGRRGGREREIFFFSFVPGLSPVHTDT